MVVLDHYMLLILITSMPNPSIFPFARETSVLWRSACSYSRRSDDPVRTLLLMANTLTNGPGNAELGHQSQKRGFKEIINYVNPLRGLETVRPADFGAGEKLPFWRIPEVNVIFKRLFWHSKLIVHVGKWMKGLSDEKPTWRKAWSTRSVAGKAGKRPNSISRHTENNTMSATWGRNGPRRRKGFCSPEGMICIRFRIKERFLDRWRRKKGERSRCCWPSFYVFLDESDMYAWCLEKRRHHFRQTLWEHYELGYIAPHPSRLSNVSRCLWSIMKFMHKKPLG